MSLLKSSTVDLSRAAEKARTSLKAISTASRETTNLSTSAILGVLGFFLFAGATFGALAELSLLPYAPFVTPVSGSCGLLLGVLCARDRKYRAIEQRSDLIERAWALRNSEVQILTSQIKSAIRSGSQWRDALEKRLTDLLVASPDELIARYRLGDQGTVATILLPPPDRSGLQAPIEMPIKENQE